MSDASMMLATRRVQEVLAFGRGAGGDRAAKVEQMMDRFALSPEDRSSIRIQLGLPEPKPKGKAASKA